MRTSGSPRPEGTTAGRRPFTVGELMVRDFVAVQIDDDLASVAELMRSQEIDQAPVFEEGRLMGLITRAGVERALESALEPFDQQESLWFGTRRVAASLTARAATDWAVVVVPPNRVACEAAQMLERRGVPCLLVAEQGYVTGLITATELPAPPERTCIDPATGDQWPCALCS